MEKEHILNTYDRLDQNKTQTARGLGIGLLVGILPGMGQANGEVMALVIPMNLALVLGSLWLFGAPVNRSDPHAGG